MSRSASRTRWMMFCFAAWAAIRPNFSGGSRWSCSSPIWASESTFSASASAISFSGFVTASTTVFTSKSSISPSSGLNSASIRFSGPKVFFAADTIASLRASMMIFRSIPFSLQTCSMTRFRSGNIRPPVPSSGVRPPRRATEIVLDVCLLDRRERKHDAADVGVMDRHALGGHRLERPVEHAAVTDRTMGPDPHPLPERAKEVRLAQQGPVDARGRTLELVAAGDRVVRIEHVAELTGHASQLVDRDAALRAVDQQPQHQPPALGAVLHVDELEPRPEDEGLPQLPDAVRHRGRVHVMRSSKIKKWARGPLRLVSEGRKARILYHLAKRPATVKSRSGHAYISSMTGR